MIAATLFGISPLAWAGISSAVFCIGLILFGIYIAAAAGRAGGYPVHPLPSEPETAAELDEWLALDGIEFDFKVCKRPVASVQINDKGAAEIATPDATTHER